jgi:hypothetical protein
MHLGAVRVGERHSGAQHLLAYEAYEQSRQLEAPPVIGFMPVLIPARTCIEARVSLERASF